MINRPHLFLLFVLLGFFNPITLFWFPYTGLTWVFVVPLTLTIWFLVRWREIVDITETAKRYEILLGCTIYSSNLVRNTLGFLGTPGFGLLDMFITFISVCIAFYGLKGLKHFVLPTTYLLVMVVVYQLEFAITEVAFLENFLAHLITSILNIFTITASANNNLVTLYSRQGNRYYLLIDAPCTGIKGMLAYGALAVLMVLDIKTTYKRKLLWTAIGGIGTFLVNILRLLSIFLAAYLLEIDMALAIHTYLGYILFIIWVLIYWTIAFKFMPIPEKRLNIEL